MDGFQKKKNWEQEPENQIIGCCLQTHFLHATVLSKVFNFTQIKYHWLHSVMTPVDPVWIQTDAAHNKAAGL